jgi:hypothetical protein
MFFFIKSLQTHLWYFRDYNLFKLIKEIEQRIFILFSHYRFNIIFTIKFSTNA